MPTKIKSNYCKAVIIVHGKSEYLISQHIKSCLHLPIEIYAKKNGRNSIQITSLNKELNNTIFKNKNSLLKNYEIETRGKEIINFKLFIIMDTDDCTEEEKENYINKNMFKGHWIYDYIVPIYNIDNLEKVLRDAKIEHRIIKDSEKSRTYVKLFPNVSAKTVQETDMQQLKSLLHKLEKIKTTNLDELIDYCIGQAMEFKK